MELKYVEQNNHLFYPFNLIRDLVDLRIGILTIREKWKFLKLKINPKNPVQLPSILNSKEKVVLKNIADFITYNSWAIEQDFALITKNRTSAPISNTNKIQNKKNIFIEKGAIVEHCFLNANEGPIYIGKNALIMEGSMLRGTIAICKNAVVKMGTKIYAGTTVGPYCTVGGEIKNSILMAFSNKAHDGYLGDSIIGEWCNLGAGTSNSNLKNNASAIELQLQDCTIKSGNKFGLLLGDYSKVAINTSFNTGTVVGVCCNVFYTGLTPKYIPNFSWGFTNNPIYDLDKAFIDIDKWKKMKGKRITKIEKLKLKKAFNL